MALKFLFGQAVFELLIEFDQKSILHIDQEPLGLLKFYCQFCVSRSQTTVFGVSDFRFVVVLP